MNKPCANCPFRKGNTWFAVCNKIMALKELDRQQIFACHMKHPQNNIFSLNDMKEDDCAGFRMSKENMAINGTHPQIVDSFGDTEPSNAAGLKYWANKENYTSPLNLV